MAFDDEAVLKALFAAGSGIDDPVSLAPRDLWSDFLAILAKRLGAQAAGLVRLRANAPVQSWSHGGLAPHLSQDMFERMRNLRVYTQSDLPAAPEDLPPMRALRASIDPASHVVLWVAREGREFRAADGVSLTRIAPYLGPALLTWQALEHARETARMERQIGRDLGGFWLRLSGAGRVVEAAEGLTGYLAGTALQITEQGWPEFGSPHQARAFRAALTALGTSEGGSRRERLDLGAQRPLEMVLQKPAQSSTILAHLRRPPRAADLGEARVMAEFGLARSEARLAICLCDGLSLAEAGESLGWSRETVRSYSKQLYARLGTNGQSGVIRQITGSALWLGQGAPTSD